MANVRTCMDDLIVVAVSFLHIGGIGKQMQIKQEAPMFPLIEI